MKISNKAYDVLMVTAQIVLPGLATLYAAVSGILGLSGTDKVLGIIVAVDTFLGAVLKGLSTKYTPETAGHIAVDDSGDKTIYQIQLNGEVDDVLSGKKNVTLSVGPGEIKPVAA
jgi:hypothetical protein